VFPIDDDGWEETPLVSGDKLHLAAAVFPWPVGKVLPASGYGTYLNTDFAATASSYPNMTMYANILHSVDMNAVRDTIVDGLFNKC
jgi:hypothetical protein